MRASNTVLGAVLVSLLGAMGACGGSASRATQSDIPIRRVVLYQNGVGYFERQGSLDGNVLTLQARPSQINDLLKSLTILDASNGRAISISLPLDKAGSLRLTELPPQVRNASGVLGILRVFRGARVVIKGKKGRVEGRVVGVEKLESQIGGETVSDWRATVKSDGGTLRVYRVSDIEEITLRDRTLAVGLDQSLDIALGEGNWKPVELKVRLTGTSIHKIMASYIVEMPRWKPAYRLVVGKDGKPLLQGWAVVDNVSGEDWNNVQLSLVAGSPMSFRYDLHRPQFSRRVDLTPSQNETAPAPVIERSGFTQPDSVVAAEPAPPSARAKPRAAPSRRSRSRSRGRKKVKRSRSGFADDFDGLAGASAEAEEDAPFDYDEVVRNQPKANVGGSSVGALFRYDLKDRVTIADRSSALVNIVNGVVPGKEVVLFRPETDYRHGKLHPYRAVMFANDTGFTLEKGPVTIYSKGTFVGEGFIERLEKGANAFVTYATDGLVELEVAKSRSDEGLKLLKVIDGMLVSEVLNIERSTYRINNRRGESMTAYIKTRRKDGWNLRNKLKGIVETDNSMWIPVEVASTGKSNFEVEWTKPVIRRVAIDSSMSTSLLRAYLGNGNPPAAVKKQIDAILAQKRKLTELAAQRRRINKEHSAMSRDQRRVRKNLNLLRKTKGQRQLMNELTAKLAKLERQLGTASAKLVRISEQEAAIKRGIRQAIRNVTLDTSKATR